MLLKRFCENVINKNCENVIKKKEREALLLYTLATRLGGMQGNYVACWN